MSVRVEEIRQENRHGDVSAVDIEWLCGQADEAERMRSHIRSASGLGTQADDPGQVRVRFRREDWASLLALGEEPPGEGRSIGASTKGGTE